MKIAYIVPVLLLCANVSFAQPAWSPEVRTEREMKWMTDSLHITPAQAQKIMPAVLQYHRNMDIAKSAKDKKCNGRTQKQIMKKKDSSVKAALHNDKLYSKYYKNEQLIRKSESVIYKGPHQPL